ncbi:hypothetical protein HRG_014048 [Hirsutella rhossiliensis]
MESAAGGGPRGAGGGASPAQEAHGPRGALETPVEDGPGGDAWRPIGATANGGDIAQPRQGEADMGIGWNGHTTPQPSVDEGAKRRREDHRGSRDSKPTQGSRCCGVSSPGRHRSQPVSHRRRARAARLEASRRRGTSGLGRF